MAVFFPDIAVTLSCYVVITSIHSCILQQRTASYEPSSWEGRRGSAPPASPSCLSVASPVLLPARTNSFHGSSCPLSSYPWYVGLVSACAGRLSVKIVLIACFRWTQYPHVFSWYAR